MDKNKSKLANVIKGMQLNQLNDLPKSEQKGSNQSRIIQVKDSGELSNIIT